MSIRGSYLRRTVMDADGRVAGRIEATYPFDGSTPEFAIVRCGRFGHRVMVPVAEFRTSGEVVTMPYSRTDLEDAPELDGIRYVDDAVSRSRGYWSLVSPDRPVQLRYLPLTPVG
jgi:hypothetical protein